MGVVYGCNKGCDMSWVSVSKSWQQKLRCMHSSTIYKPCRSSTVHSLENFLWRKSLAKHEHYKPLLIGSAIPKPLLLSMSTTAAAGV